MAPQGVAVGDLSVNELQTYIKVLRDELQVLMNQYGALKTARERYLDSKQTLESLEQCKEGEKILIPITHSLFVRGELGATDSAIIEMGAGYYVKMSTTKGKDFMMRKTKGLTNMMQEIEKNVHLKQQQLQIMEETFQQKARTAGPPPA
ncbi:putative prefoldin subunit 5 [Diplonema papillatum]|nr:putative prefoldin subunit 5 [Diplonema papillatum]